MKKLYISIIVLFVTASCAFTARGPQRITESEVRSMLSKVEEVTKAKDVKAIMSYIAEDVAISITARGPLGSTKKTMGYEDYERELRLGMSLTKDYEFKSNIQSITIAPDGLSAIVVADIYEVVEMMGVKAASFTKETSLIQRRDGMLKAVKISAESEIQLTPGPETGTPSVTEGI